MNQIISNKEEIEFIINNSYIIDYGWPNYRAIDFEVGLRVNANRIPEQLKEFLTRKIKLVFEFTTAFKLQLSFDKTIKELQIGNFKFINIDSYNYNINIEFAHNSNGYINFNCNDFHLEIE